MKLKLNLIISTIIAATSFSAFADHKHDYYVGATVGTSFVEQELRGTSDLSENALSYSFKAGAKLTHNIFVELEHKRFNPANAQIFDDGFLDVNSEIKASTTSASLLAAYEITNRLSLGAKIGLTKWDVDQKLNNHSNTNFGGESGSFSDSDNGYGFSTGLFVSYDFSDEITSFAEFNMLNADAEVFDESADVTLNNVSMGLNYAF